jgi:ubiquinone/menaquinone biosynthesis C-methylase UbiE
MNSPWYLPRVPEPEEMDCSDEVEVYNSAAAEAHLDRIDNSFVAHLLRLMPGGGSPKLPGLDIGCGPAQIPVKILQRIPGLRMVALDGSVNMLRCARENSRKAELENRLLLVRGDGKVLPFADEAFSVVCCNSVLHHALDPIALLQEIRRVAAPDAAILLRDLRRPAFPVQRLHLWRHGRKYHGLMRQLFDASVRAAYTTDELGVMLRRAQIPRARVFRYRGAHLGIERAAQVRMPAVRE